MDALLPRADVRRVATRRRCAMSDTICAPVVSVSSNSPISPGALARYARSDGRNARRLARAMNCPRLMPGQQSLTNCRTVVSSDSGVTSPGSASATSSNASAIAKHVLLHSGLVGLTDAMNGGYRYSPGGAVTPDFARCNRHAATPATDHRFHCKVPDSGKVANRTVLLR